VSRKVYMVFRILPLWDYCDEGLPPWHHLTAATPGELELAAERFAWGGLWPQEVVVSARICWLASQANRLFQPPPDWPSGARNWGLDPLQTEILMVLALKNSDRLVRSVYGTATLITSQVLREDNRLIETARHFLLTSMGSIQDLCQPQKRYQTAAH